VYKRERDRERKFVTVRKRCSVVFRKNEFMSDTERAASEREEQGGMCGVGGDKARGMGEGHDSRRKKWRNIFTCVDKNRQPARPAHP